MTGLPRSRTQINSTVDLFADRYARPLSLQVALVESDDVVQQIAPATLNPTLRDAVLPGTPEGRAQRPNGHRPDRCRHLQSILGIPVKDEKPRSRLIR